MRKIDFGKIMIQHSFEGDPVAVDMRKKIGNKIHQTTGDIGFDDFARQIYFSEGETDYQGKLSCKCTKSI